MAKMAKVRNDLVRNGCKPFSIASPPPPTPISSQSFVSKKGRCPSFKFLCCKMYKHSPVNVCCRAANAGSTHLNRQAYFMKTCPFNVDPPYTPLLYSKNRVYRGIHFFSYFAPKHRLWVLVRTASLRRF